MEAQGRRDRRYLDQSEFEAAVNYQTQPQTQRTLEDAALKNLHLEKLRKSVAELDDQDQQLFSFRYDGETLMTTVLPPIRFVVSGLLSQGLHILAGEVE